MKIDPDDFLAWRDHPITKLALESFRKRADDMQHIWNSETWNERELSSEQLVVKRAGLVHGAAAYLRCAEVSLEDIE